MQYRKHNLYKNFTAAAATDVDMAWEILINEINELAIDRPAKLIAALKAANVKVTGNPSAKTLSLLVHDNVYKNTILQTKLVQAMADRHKDAYVNADGGATGDNNELQSSLTTIIDDKAVPSPIENKKKLLADLASKLKQRGLKMGINPIKLIVTLGLITGAIYLGYKLYKNQPLIK